MHKVSFVLLALYFFCPSAGYAQNKYSTNQARYSNIKAGMKDRHLELEALRAANRRGSDLRCREDFFYAKITSEDWIIDHNEEGFITGRHLHMELYGETSDGRCGVSHCVFKQKMLGDHTYATKLRLADMGPLYSMECED